MKCPHCVDGKVTLFTSVEDCEHCGGTGLAEKRTGLVGECMYAAPGGLRSGIEVQLANPSPQMRARIAEAILRLLETTTPITLTQPIKLDER